MHHIHIGLNVLLCSSLSLLLKLPLPDKLWYIKDVTLCTGNQTSQGHDTNLSSTVCYSQLHSLWQEVMRDSFIDTDLCNNYTASCMHYWSGLLIKSYFTVKVCWFDALQHKSLLTSNWFGTPTAEWWMLRQINTHRTIYIYCLNGVVTDTG